MSNTWKSASGLDGVYKYFRGKYEMMQWVWRSRKDCPPNCFAAVNLEEIITELWRCFSFCSFWTQYFASPLAVVEWIMILIRSYIFSAPQLVPQVPLVSYVQVLFLMYHYFAATEIYNAIRLFIAAYVWMTGFGNFSYYYVRKDFSLGRFAQVLALYVFNISCLSNLHNCVLLTLNILLVRWCGA